MTKHRQASNRIADRILQLCTSPDNVSTLVAKEPSLTPGDAWEKLYGGRALKSEAARVEDDDTSSISRSSGSSGGLDDLSGPVPQDELERAARCGNWGSTNPSELFLRVCVDGVKLTWYSKMIVDAPRYTTMPFAPSIRTLAVLWLAPP